MTHTILRIPAAKTQSGYSRSTIYLRIAQGLWTKPVSLGPRAVGCGAGSGAASGAGVGSGAGGCLARVRLAAGAGFGAPGSEAVKLSGSARGAAFGAIRSAIVPPMRLSTGASTSAPPCRTPPIAPAAAVWPTLYRSCTLPAMLPCWVAKSDAAPPADA